MKIPKTKIEWLITTKSSVAYGYENFVGYAIIGENYNEITSLVSCRDVLQYNFWREVMYDENRAKPKISKQKTLLMFFCPHIMDDEVARSARDFLNQIEQHIGFSLTKVFLPSNPLKRASTLLFEGSPRWQSTPVLFSLYSFLIRIASSHKIGDSFQKTFARIKNGKIASSRHVSNNQSFIHGIESRFAGLSKKTEELGVFLPKRDDKGLVAKAEKMVNWLAEFGILKMSYVQRSRNYEGGPINIYGMQSYVSDVERVSKKVAKGEKHNISQAQKKYPKWFVCQTQKSESKRLKSNDESVTKVKKAVKNSKDSAKTKSKPKNSKTTSNSTTTRTRRRKVSNETA